MKNIVGFFHSEQVKRTLRTFFQAFIGVILSSLSSGLKLDKSMIFSLLSSAIAAGIAAIMNKNKYQDQDDLE